MPKSLNVLWMFLNDVCTFSFVGFNLHSKKQIYIVKSGDTLSEIAEDYRTSVTKIKRLNRLRSDKIRIGQKLREK